MPFLMSLFWIVPSLIFADVISDPATALPLIANPTAMIPRTTPGVRRLRISLSLPWSFGQGNVVRLY